MRRSWHALLVLAVATATCDGDGADVGDECSIPEDCPGDDLYCVEHTGGDCDWARCTRMCASDAECPEPTLCETGFCEDAAWCGRTFGNECMTSLDCGMMELCEFRNCVPF